MDNDANCCRSLPANAETNFAIALRHGHWIFRLPKGRLYAKLFRHHLTWSRARLNPCVRFLRWCVRRENQNDSSRRCFPRFRPSCLKLRQFAELPYCRFFRCHGQPVHFHAHSHCFRDQTVHFRESRQHWHFRQRHDGPLAWMHGRHRRVRHLACRQIVVLPHVELALPDHEMILAQQAAGVA